MRKTQEHCQRDTTAKTSCDVSRSGSAIGGEVIGPFLVLGLPRSRTAWLSRFLTYGDWICGHDELRNMRSLDDVQTWLSQPCVGSAETAAAPFWRLIDPNIRIVIVRRPVADVVESLMRLPGCAFDRDALTTAMTKLDRKLDQIAARRDVLQVSFADLENETTCAAVFEYCLPYAHDPQWWAMWSAVNVQCDMRAYMRLCDAFRPALDKLGKVAKHRTLTQMALRKAKTPDGFTFQTERFDDWLDDAAHLLAEHHFQIGESPDNWRNKNIPLLRALDDLGAMQITTARSNGRMFGYLMTLITPSLVTEGVMTAVNTAFFADPSAPGVGLKLQREALASFREKGIGQVFWETNTVGGGDRIGAIYKRLGAEEKGSVYRLNLAEAA
jgi:hypothetical protein